MDFLEQLGLERPVVQAGMGGGVARGELAGAVSAAGGLGTVGIMAPAAFGSALGHARRRAAGRPVAANLLVPFTRKAHVQACIDHGVAQVVFHGGRPTRWIAPLRRAGIPVFVTVGSAEEARRALDDGADGLVAQGVEAGGHLAGAQPLVSLLPAVLDVSDGRAPVLAAGGVADSADVRRLLDLGARAAVAGTRFLLTYESPAHPAYKQRVIEAERTMVTLLFGLGWPMRHRVVPNAATERWCVDDDLAPRWVRGIGHASAVIGRTLPLGASGRMTGLQRVGLPFFSPGVPLAGMPDDSVETLALYAGETHRRIAEVVSAAEAVEQLSS